MNGLSFAFETPRWELILQALPNGSSYPAAQFLTLMESEDDAAMDEALELLEEKDILLDVASLPSGVAGGEAALRLKREAQLAKSGDLLSGLEADDALRIFLEEISGIPVCGDPQLLAESVRDGDDSAKDALVNGMLSLVVQRACEMTGRGVLLLDLIQEGSLGLWQAILGYESGSFESCCDRCICRAMAKTITRQAHANGVGQKMRQAMEDYRSVDERLLSEWGRNPTLEEIADQLHMTPETAAVVADMLESARLVNRVKTEAQPQEPTPEDNMAVEDTAYFQMRQRISELLSVLEPQDAQLLSLRFGLEGGMPMSPAEAGAKLGLTPEEVTKKETEALMKLRKER